MRERKKKEFPLCKSKWQSVTNDSYLIETVRRPKNLTFFPMYYSFRERNRQVFVIFSPSDISEFLGMKQFNIYKKITVSSVKYSNATYV